MVWATGYVCDAVTLQKLLEFFGIVAWAIVTSVKVRVGGDARFSLCGGQ